MQTVQFAFFLDTWNWIERVVYFDGRFIFDRKDCVGTSLCDAFTKERHTIYV